MIEHNTRFRNFETLTMNSSNTADYQIQIFHDNEVNIPEFLEVVGASKTDEQNPNQPPVPPVEVFDTKVSNVSEWLVADKLTEDGTMSYVDVEKRSSKFGGYWPTMSVTNLEFPHESPI